MNSPTDKTNPLKTLQRNISFSSDEGNLQFNVTVSKAQLNQLLQKADKATFDMDGDLLGDIRQIDFVEPNVARVTGLFRTYPEESDEGRAAAEVSETAHSLVDDTSEAIESTPQSHDDKVGEFEEVSDDALDGSMDDISDRSSEESPVSDAVDEQQGPTITIDGREIEGTIDIEFSAVSGRPHAEIVHVDAPGLTLDSAVIQKINAKFAKEFDAEIGESKSAGVKSITVVDDTLSVAVRTPISDSWLNTVRFGKFAMNIPTYNKSADGEDYRWPLPWLPVVSIRSKAKGESRPRVAVGLVAVGDIAIGLVSAGGVAVGLLSAGGIALGLISLGGIALGWWLAAGGIALSNWIGLGGIALAKTLTVGAIALTLEGYAFGAIAAARNALGAIAIGRVAFGVIAIGQHGWGIIPITGDFWQALKMFFGGGRPG